MLDADDEQVIEDAKGGGGVLVTWDRVVRQAAGGLTPYEALDKAIAEGAGTKEAQAEVSRLRKLSPIELINVAGAANKTYKAFQKYIEVSELSAKQIRHLRIDESYSWRAVSRYCSRLWGAPWGANQLAGMVICEKAAKLTGEDFLEPPWN